MAATIFWDGPVLTLLNNRIRALQTELDDPKSEDKPTIVALIDELQNLREPLSSALAQQFQQHSPNEVLFRNCASFQRLVDGIFTPQPRDLEKIATNSGHATTLATTDAPTPALRQIERAATPVTYPPRNLLLLIHEHLQTSGYLQTASMLLKEAQLEPLPSLVSPSSLVQQPSIEETSPVQLQWPSGRVPGFLSMKLKRNAMDKVAESQCKNPIILPMKHKLSDLNDTGVLSSSVKRLNAGDLAISAMGKNSLWTDATGLYMPSSNLRNQQGPCTADYVNESQSSMSNHGHVIPSSIINYHQPNNQERITLDSLVVQYLKHQGCQCQTPIATRPPLSVLHPYVCPELQRSLDAPSNVTFRLATREFKSMHGGGYENRRDRQFIYSRFRQSQTAVFDHLLTCITFLGHSSSIVVGASSGTLKIVDYTSMAGWEMLQCHDYPLTSLHSFVYDDSQLCLSSSCGEVVLWNASQLLFCDEGWPKIHLFEGCKAARFSNSGNVFAALSSDYAQRDILLFDIQTCQLESTLSDTSTTVFTGRGQRYSLIHFNHSDSILFWNGVLWDRRVSGPVYRFDRSPDYGGGGFHPSGNEIILNSEVWDMRKFRLLHTVPSLDQTKIAFNARGDVIYAILRSSIEDYVMSRLNPRRPKHPLSAAFRTVDAVNYSDIAITPMSHCIVDFATDPTDSFVGFLTLSQPEGHSFIRIYEIGKQGCDAPANPL